MGQQGARVHTPCRCHGSVDEEVSNGVGVTEGVMGLKPLY